ncbi:MAG: DUF6659 family protein [Candidatus Nitrosotenuis sp.]|uniref:Roadblock/LAMTOR2 domain-containing protein n=1 Tax=Candidatus Nitrosotenuis uzonensis TaxID=1407055 RepID=V6AST3_9ARCH|nr:DUF6659 family protein [Candidatus Nitrosotenuis uzonensis]MCA2003530.1 hypothetical protein [Candidatus Nitrosotenuis sp.]CAE6498114.1 conserved hypothetical protein [Candidatus Nitrosotenuis uzonensis]CDI05776.1 conserved hypothetical protein [Candidatus Nitrosotenuis uzonensis]
MDKETLCNQIRSLDPSVRFVGLINDKGRLVAGGMASGKSSLEDTKKDEMLFMELALRVRMRQEFDPELGPVRFALSYRDKVIVISFPLNKEILLISAEKEIDFAKFPFKVLKAIEEYSK